MNVANCIDELSATTSRLEKEALLKFNLTEGGDLLKKVLIYTYNPFYTFYIKKIPEFHFNEGAQVDKPWELVFDTLDKLRSRSVTGRAAEFTLGLTLSTIPGHVARVLVKIIEKDWGCGVSVKTINKVIPGLIPEFAVMLASKDDAANRARIRFPAYEQLKCDGMRFSVIPVDGKAKFYSRKGQELIFPDCPIVREFNALIARYGNFVYDGELLISLGGGQVANRQTGNGVLNKASKGTISQAEADKVVASLWDIIPYDAYLTGKYDVEYVDRYQNLVDICHSVLLSAVSVLESNLVNSWEEATVFYNQNVAAGLEGSIIKNLKGYWENKRSRDQVKMKEFIDDEFEVTEWHEGDGKYTGLLGSMSVRSIPGTDTHKEHGDFVTRCNARGDEMRTLKPEDIIGKKATIKYNQVTTDQGGVKSLYLPVFVEFREDI